MVLINKNRTWAEISLNAIEHNFTEIKNSAQGEKVLCILKANAYGHGSVPIAKRLQKAGADYFGVATVGEALDLRTANIETPILLLGYVDESDATLIAQYNITASVYDYETAKVLSSAAKLTGKTIKIHIKLDTGMTRLGFQTDNIDVNADWIMESVSLEGLDVEGIFTHFAVSDEIDGNAYTNLQVDRFHAMCNALESRGLNIPIKHCANSGAILQHKKIHFNMVRAGIILYGYYPDSKLEKTIDLIPAMKLKARVVQVRDVPKGTPVSYGLKYTTEKDTKLAIISIGYADGYIRKGSGQAKILINGEIAPIRGRICMDMCMADITDIPNVERGDEVTIFDNKKYTAADVANAADTITYEVLCAVSHRVPRIYID